MNHVSDCDFGVYNKTYSNVWLYKVSLGDFSYIADNTRISRAKIGKFCSIANDVKCGLGKHPSSGFVSTHPAFFSMQEQAGITFSDKDHFVENDPITIGNDVWIGTSAIIMDGVTIADGAIIGAGAVVTKDVPPYAIVAGVPAKLIRYRFDQKVIDELLKIKWWDKEQEWLLSHFKAFHNVSSFIDLIKKEK